MIGFASTLKRRRKMKGYKGFNSDLTCKGFKYEIGKTYEMNERPIICEKGFHFCYSLKDVLPNYPLHKKHTFCEIEACGDVVSDEFYKKCCTNKIKVLRKLDLDEILDIIGMKNKEDFIKYYNDDRFNEHQMFLIYYGLQEGFDVSTYAKPVFNESQMYMICLGLERGLDVSIYAKPVFADDQMYLIYYGLAKGLDVSIYAKPEFHYIEMHCMLHKLLKEEKNNGHSK